MVSAESKGCMRTSGSREDFISLYPSSLCTIHITSEIVYSSTTITLIDADLSVTH